jgi:hypothetical protein
MQMDFIPSCDFTDPRPVLPEGVAQCDGLVDRVGLLSV